MFFTPADYAIAEKPPNYIFVPSVVRFEPKSLTPTDIRYSWASFKIVKIFSFVLSRGENPKTMKIIMEFMSSHQCIWLKNCCNGPYGKNINSGYFLL